MIKILAAVNWNFYWKLSELHCTISSHVHFKVLLFEQEAECAYVVILMALYWCTEVLPLAVTALLPAVLFPLFGIMPSKDVRKNQYGSIMFMYHSS